MAMPRPCLFKTEALATDLRSEAARGLVAVRNATLLDDLRAVVQCDHGRPGCWATIAAFDLEVIADDYAQRCREQSPAGCRLQYRVVRLERAT
jgi:hypothetical protein